MSISDKAVPGDSVLILGAGAIGCAAALTLVRRGFKVTLLDRDEPASGTSHGNAGGIVPSAGPLARPGLPLSVPGMLMDPNGPLTIRPTQMIKALPWFLRFLQECGKKRAEANSIAEYALAGSAAPAWKDLVRGTPAESMLRDVGWMKVFSSDASFNGFADELAFMDRRGAPYQVLSADELRQMEPNLAPIFSHAVWQPDGLFAVNPGRMIKLVAEAAVALGATFLKQTALDLVLEADGRVTVVTDKATHRMDRVMICAGAFSKRFAGKLGANPRLEAERGYHAMFKSPDKSLNRPIFWVDNSMVLCPMEQGMRLTTQSEFAGLDAPPNYTRLNRLVAKAGEMLPSLDTTVTERWMGRRPATPDSLPYLGPAPATDRAFFNFGHNHLGLTMAAISAQVAADLWTGQDTIDPLPYRALR